MYLYPTKLENIDEVSLNYIPPRYDSARKKILRSVVKRRGATLYQIIEEIEDLSKNNDDNNPTNNIIVHISMMKKQRLMYSEELICDCCKHQVRVYYATDNGKRLIA